MTYVTKEKLFSKEWFKAYALITLGAFILAAGFVLFVDPHRIAPGGVYGIGIITHYLTKGMFAWAPAGRITYRYCRANTKYSINNNRHKDFRPQVRS